MQPNNITKASRHGRYRKSLLDPQSLLPIASRLEAVFGELNQKRQAGILGDSEFLAYGLLSLLACRRENAFQSNKSKTRGNVIANTTTDFTLADFWSLLCAHKLPLEHYRKILDQPVSLQEFLARIRFRGIPDAAQLALLKWLNNEYPLILMFYIPSPSEVFELQKQGRRCISFFMLAAELTTCHHDRDALSFIIHDLIHAHEFYANSQRAKQQIGFYDWLDNIKNNAALVKFKTESSSFHENWDYVLSDMNSYCGHLLKTLNAAFTIHAQSDEDKLLWQNIVEASDLEPDEKYLFRKINSVEWDETDFLSLELLFERRYEMIGKTVFKPSTNGLS